MNKKWSRVIGLIVALSLLVTLAACGGKASEPEVPVFSIDGNCLLIIENPDPELYYEIRANGETLGALMLRDLADYYLPCGAMISLRSMNPENGATSPWSQEQMVPPADDAGGNWEDPYGSNLTQLPTPEVSVSSTGLVTVVADENAEFIRLVDLNSGREITYMDDFENRLEPGMTVVAYAIGDGIRFRDSEPSEPVSFDVESITFSATENPLSNATENPDGSRTLIAYSNRGNAYEFRIEGKVTEEPGIWGRLESGSVLYNVDAIHGIFAQKYSDNSADAGILNWGSGFMLDGSDRVTSSEDMDNWFTGMTMPIGYLPVDGIPSYFAIGDKPALSVGGGEPTEGEFLRLESVTIYFDGIETRIERFSLHEFFRRAVFLPGTPYITQGMDYPLKMYCTHGDLPEFAVDYFDMYNVRAGNLKDAQGNVISNPVGHHMQPGDTLELYLTEDYKIDLPMLGETLQNAATANEARPYTFSKTTGEMNVIVVPIVWNDQKDRASQQNLDIIRRAFGNVMDETGKVTVYKPQVAGELSLSEYFSAASYGQLTINAFVTDWYAFDADYAQMKDQRWDLAYERVYEWIRATYPGLDLTRFDNDGDAILDEIVFINTASYTEGGEMSGFAGSYRYVNAMTGGIEYAHNGTLEQPAIHHYVNLTLGHLFAGGEIGGEPETGVVIHELGHTIALNDYYDAGSRGISFLGGYDMQDGSVGDWNVYSKYCAGWLKPTVVDESSFAGGNTAEFTLRASALYGDALVIPAAGYDYNGTPFDEYIMVDLFVPEGLHKEDSALYGLQDSVGVRIYHVSDLMELQTTENRDGSTHTFGVQHYTNDSSTLYSEQFGMHQLEILSATGRNQFTQRNYSAQDLFTAGSSFAAERFGEFFHNGRMDNGMAFGYEITVKSIELVSGEYVATIVVTRK